MSRPGQTAIMSASDAASDQPSVQVPFGKALVEAARANPRVVGLTADLAKYTDLQPFAEAFPKRFINVGMAEQNLIAVAAGLAKSGKIAFATTYAVFATRRALDFVSIACAHSSANVKIVVGLPGLTTGYGGTHQAIEDLALMRAVPNLTVIDPCDATEIAQATHAIAEAEGTVYMRILRGAVPVVLDPATYRFELGRAKRLADGADVGIISTGLMTGRALEAAPELRGQGIAAGILHVPTLKPFDADAVAEFAAGVDRLIVAENHVVSGGLASAVTEALYRRGILKPMARLGIPDRFIECGSVPYLQDKYGLTAGAIVEAARAA
jgi:transketolase